MFRRNRTRGVGQKGRISAADVNSKIGLRDWPMNWSVPVLEKPGSCLVLFFYCLFAYPRDTKVRTRLNVSARSRLNWNLEVFVSQERIKPEYQEKILSEQEWEPTTNSTHIWRRRRETNPHHTGGRRVLSSLGHPCSPPPPPPPLSQLSCLARSGTLARQAMSSQCARQRVRKNPPLWNQKPLLFRLIEGIWSTVRYYKRFHKKLLFGVFWILFIVFPFLTVRWLSKCYSEGRRKIRHCFSANKFPGKNFQSEMLKRSSPGILGTIPLTKKLGSI